jgi:hypothetical protein
MATAQEATAQAPASTDDSLGSGGAGESVREAAEIATHQGIITINIAGRRIGLLPPEQIGLFVGLGLLVAFNVIEWPVALVVAVGHTIAYRTQRAGLRSFGAAFARA